MLYGTKLRNIFQFYVIWHHFFCRKKVSARTKTNEKARAVRLTRFFPSPAAPVKNGDALYKMRICFDPLLPVPPLQEGQGGCFKSRLHRAKNAGKPQRAQSLHGSVHNSSPPLCELCENSLRTLRLKNIF
jgi:hypothetical protein